MVASTRGDVMPHEGAARSELRPLTERLLAGLPGPRPAWIALWALVPWANAGLNVLLDTGGTSAVWEKGDVLVVLNYAALSFAVAFTLWGNRRIAERLESLRGETAGVLTADDRRPFRGMNSVAGPMLLTVAAAVGFAVTALVRDSESSALLRGLTWLVIGVPLFTFLWTYVSLQLGLDRLGRERLRPDAPRVDPALGLRPLGDVAFMGLWMLLAWLVPVLLTGLPDIVGACVGMAVLGGGLLAFYVSLVRLHRQMREAKRSEVELARSLYAQAYDPLRTTPTLDTLEQQRALIGAADGLEKRANAIHEWPIDEGTLARVLTITTSVIAMTIGRLILEPLGF